MERGDCPAQYRMVPSEEMSRNHQQDADALHDVEGYVPSLSHWSSFRAVRNVIIRSVVAVDNPGWIPDHDGMGRNVEIHEGKGGDQDIVTNRDISNDTSIAPDPYVVSDGRIAPSLPTELHSDGNASVHRTVLSDDSVVVYGDIATMDQDETFSDPRMPTDLDSRYPGTTPEHPSGKEGMPAALVQPEPEYPTEIRFPDGRVQQTPESFSSVVPIQVRE